MDATVVLIDSDAELARARALADQLWDLDDPADIARLEAQARLVAAYEERRWRRRRRAERIIRHLVDQHGLTRADMVPILGTPSRVSEVLGGKKGLGMAMVQRLRARFRVSADLLSHRRSELPPAARRSGLRPNKRRRRHEHRADPGILRAVHRPLRLGRGGRGRPVRRARAGPTHPTGQALCAKGRAAPELVYHRDRLTTAQADPPKGRSRSRLAADRLGRGARHHRCRDAADSRTARPGEHSPSAWPRPRPPQLPTPPGGYGG